MRTKKTAGKKTKKLSITAARLAAIERFADAQCVTVKDIVTLPAAERNELMKGQITETKHWRVRCIDDSGMSTPRHSHPKGAIKAGQVYHVERTLENGAGYVLLGKPSIWDDGHEVGWDFKRFEVLGSAK